MSRRCRPRSVFPAQPVADLGIPREQADTSGVREFERQHQARVVDAAVKLQGEIGGDTHPVGIDPPPALVTQMLGVLVRRRRLAGLPGATTPSNFRTEDQVAADEELLTRLVALNQERATEEAHGVVRWLRPEYQIPKLGHKVAAPEGEQTEAYLAVVAKADKPIWPADGLDQIRIIVDVLSRSSAPVLPDALTAAFDGRNTPKRKPRIEEVLNTLVATGTANTGQLNGETRYFLPR